MDGELNDKTCREAFPAIGGSQFDLLKNLLDPTEAQLKAQNSLSPPERPNPQLKDRMESALLCTDIFDGAQIDSTIKQLQKRLSPEG